MKAYRINTPAGRSFTTDNAAEISAAPVGSNVEVVEMTDEEYHALPATNESAAFFAAAE